MHVPLSPSHISRNKDKSRGDNLNGVIVVQWMIQTTSVCVCVCVCVWCVCV